MDPLQATRQTTAAARPSATWAGLGIESTGPVATDAASFDGTGRLTAIDLSRGNEITVSSSNPDDAASLRAVYYELGWTRDGPISVSLPGIEGRLTTRIADSQVTIRGGVSVASLALPGVFASSDTNGSRHYRAELGPLGMDIRSDQAVALLDAASEATAATYAAAARAGDAVVGAFESARAGVAGAWRWATGSPQATVPARLPTPRDGGEVLREARFLAPLAEAAYAGSPTPANATREPIDGLFRSDDGFHADLFRTSKEGRETVVLAFRGTDDLADGVTNAEHIAHVPSQYLQAVQVTAAIRARYPDADLVLVGHSLGGGLASYAGLMTGTRAYAFNAAGPQGPTAERLPSGADTTLVTHINTESDPLTGAFGPIAARPWGNTVCTIRDPAVPAGSPEFLRSLRNRTVTVAQWLEHHSMHSVVAKLAEPTTSLDCR